ASEPFSCPRVLGRASEPSPPVPAPAGYDASRAGQPYSLLCPHGDQPPTLLRMYPYSEKHSMSFWAYRRLLDAANFDDPAVRGDVALILWYSNDYRDAPILDRPPDAVLATLRRARAVSLGFAHWLQAEAPRPDR